MRLRGASKVCPTRGTGTACRGARLQRDVSPGPARRATGAAGAVRARFPYAYDRSSPIPGDAGTPQNRRMDLEFSRGQLAILHCLRDGDDPYQALGGADPFRFGQDVARLVQLGMIERSGRRLALTLEGITHLDEPENSGPMPLGDYDV